MVRLELPAPWRTHQLLWVKMGPSGVFTVFSEIGTNAVADVDGRVRLGLFLQEVSQT